MYTEFDYRDSQERKADKSEAFFGTFSTEARQRLLSHNLEKPENLYDVFYTKTRSDLLTKNKVLFNKDLDEASKIIRELQLSTIINKTFSLEEQSEEFRNSMSSRNQLHKDNFDLVNFSLKKREELLSKNSTIENNLLQNSAKYREKNIAGGKQNISKIINNEENQEKFRLDNLSKTNNKESNIEELSKDFRIDNLANNNVKQNDIEKMSMQFRKDDISKTTSKQNDLLKDSVEYREKNLSQNSVKITDLEDESNLYRNDDLSNNTKKHSDLISDSVGFRKDDLSNNSTIKTDLGIDSVNFRKDDLSNNSTIKTDLGVDSVNFRKDDLSNNSTIETNLGFDSIEFRNDDLSNNIPKNTDLGVDSVNFRNDDLSNNTPVNTDLNSDSVNFRNDDLSNNTPINTDLEIDSVPYRDDDLSNNTPINTDLEIDSVPYRDGDLSNNVPINTDLEVDSVPYRDDDLSNNVPINTDLEVDSVPYRVDDLSNNVPINTDLEIDSVPYRVDDLSNNVPINTDLEVDSVPYRVDDLSNNVPINTDLEVDSVPYRVDDLSNNVPINTDLEVDSVPYRVDDLSNNVPTNTDLETDSVPYRVDDLSNNVPTNTDLETDSVPYRDDDLSANSAIVTDLETDSAPYRDDDLSANSTIVTDLASDSIAFREEDLSANSPNVQSLDGYYDAYGNVSNSSLAREKNLSRNIGGMLGFNVMAFGQSQYIGVSGVWMQGLLFRNMLLLRNKPGGWFYSGEDTNIDKFIDYNTGVKTTAKDVRQRNLDLDYKIPNSPFYAELEYRDRNSNSYGDRLLENSKNVPSEFYSGKFGNLPINSKPIKVLQTNIYVSKVVANQRSETSPITRNLNMAFYGSDIEGTTQKYFGIDVEKIIKVNYSLNNINLSSNVREKVKGETHLSKEKGSFSSNINALMREYLKNLNFYQLNRDGYTIKQGSYSDSMSALNNLTALQNIVIDGENTGLVDLMLHYNINLTNSASRKESLVSPGRTYIKYDYKSPDDTSIAFKKDVGNPIDDVEFATKQKGVKNIIKRISEDDTIDFSQNFKDIQGSDSGVDAPAKIFVVGKGINQKRKTSSQKYTLKNPYSVNGAGKLLFYIKNYAIPPSLGNIMYFPPYINSFQNSSSANWNSINFLGRPEPVFTYNNSSRKGSVSFTILSDFAEKVTMGRYQIDADETNADNYAMNKIIKNMSSVNFVNDSGVNVVYLDVKISEKKEQLQNLQEKVEANSDENTNDDDKDKIATLIGQISTLEDAKSVAVKGAAYREYSESDSSGFVNVYEDLLAGGEREVVNGDTIFHGVDTIKRVDEMMRNLQFQPAYFSGSLVDFKKRMTFLERLVRPARNTGTVGFSFTKAPVCHLRLGDWYDHDVIISDVSFDYGDAVWTIGSRTVQPMLAKVTIAFDIVGPAGSEGGIPLTADDKDGYYGPANGSATNNLLKDI